MKRIPQISAVMCITLRLLVRTLVKCRTFWTLVALRTSPALNL